MSMHIFIILYSVRLFVYGLISLNSFKMLLFNLDLLFKKNKMYKTLLHKVLFLLCVYNLYWIYCDIEKSFIIDSILKTVSGKIYQRPRFIGVFRKF
jgi:hypothetical protein